MTIQEYDVSRTDGGHAAAARVLWVTATWPVKIFKIPRHRNSRTFQNGAVLRTRLQRLAFAFYLLANNPLLIVFVAQPFDDVIRLGIGIRQTGSRINRVAADVVGTGERRVVVFHESARAP